MNLVQLQEQLKDLPMQAVQSYMNGANPQVPPYLAAAELQRRQSIIKSQQAQQGAAQGKQPSIKEQLEQASGLMGLQNQRAQQGMQQVAQQAQQTPMPATEGTPQPEPQPQPEVQMARGGIVNIPLRESMFRDGGVVGYAEGGAPMSPAPGALETLIKKREELRKLGMDTTKLDQQIAAMQGQGSQGEQAVPANASEMLAEAWKSATAPVEKPTTEQQLTQMRALEEGAGMPEYLKRLQGLEERYTQSTEGRGLETLMRTLAAGSSGPGGWARGYLGAQDANRAADMEHAKEIAAAYGGLSKERMSGLTQGLRDAQRSYTDLSQQGIKSRADLAGTASQAESNEAQRKTMLEQARIYAGGKGSGAAGRASTARDKLSLDQMKAEAAMLNNLLRSYPKFPTEAEKVEMANFRVRLRELQEAIAEQTTGVGSVATPGAQSGSGIDLSQWGQPKVR